MIQTFELASAFVPTMPLSLLADEPRTASKTSPPGRLPEVRLQYARRRELPVGFPPTRQIDARIASLRLRIANGTYRVSAMQLAESMIDSTFSAQDV